MSEVTQPFLDFNKFTGINNVESDPAALKLTELTEAENVYITNNNRIVSRPGYLPTFSDTSIHSLTGVGDLLLYNSGATLKYREGGASTTITTLSTTHRVRYTYDLVSKIFLTNTVDIGYIENYQYYPLQEPVEFGYRAPKAGHELAFFNGRLFIARGNVVEYTMPFYYNAVNPKANYMPFEGKITLIAPVDDGIYIADTLSTYFVKMEEDMSWSRKLVADYPAIFGTSVVRGDSLTYKMQTPYTGFYAIWDSPMGKILGMNGGSAIPLTIDTYRPQRTDGGLGSAVLVDLKDAQLHISIIQT